MTDKERLMIKELFTPNSNPKDPKENNFINHQALMIISHRKEIVL